VGAGAPSGYRPQTTSLSRSPMTLAALRLSSGTPTSARSSSIQMACFPSSTVVSHKEERKRKKASKRRKFPKESPSPKHLPAKTSQVNTDTHHFLTNTHTQIPREPNLVTALPLRGWARPALHKGSVTTRTTTSPSPYGATPPHPGAGRETHWKILPGVDGFSTTSRTSPTEKGGSMCREGGG